MWPALPRPTIAGRYVSVARACCCDHAEEDGMTLALFILTVCAVSFTGGYLIGRMLTFSAMRDLMEGK